MRGWMLLIVVVSTPMLSGCGVLSKSDATTSSWLERVRRQLAQTARDVQADLDFHENEGLEAFGNRKGDAASSVRHEICARETSESRKGGRSCALNSKLP